MAKTLETYRTQKRVQRFSTNMSPFANGMYLTKQQVPEGYVKMLVNYDIDDTGSCIRPRNGREQHQKLTYVSQSLGPATLTDYIYSYSPDYSVVEDIKDVVLSLGFYNALEEVLPLKDDEKQDEPYYVAHLTHTVDNTVYDEEGNIIQSADPTIIPYNTAWGLYCDKGETEFNKVDMSTIGYLTARTIKNGYAFNKPFAKNVGRPVYTILNNEIIAFTGSPIAYTEVPSNPNMSGYTALDTPVLSKLKLGRKTNGTYDITRDVLTPKQINAAEAETKGFNLLHEEPYVFDDVQGGSLSIIGTMLYKSQSDPLPVLTPAVGTNITWRVYYQYPTTAEKIQYKFEYMSHATPDAQWQTLTNWTELGNVGTPLWIDFTPVDVVFSVRITIRLGTDDTTSYTLTRGYDTKDTILRRLQYRKFDLSKAKGLVSWQGCVGAYGVPGAKETVFFSDIEDPSYFPFPDNYIMFDNEVLAVHNYLDYLLVITMDSLWLVTPGTSIMNSTQKRILTNIYIPEIDAINLVIIKDQVFFKTDTDFYVLKPNVYTGDSTNLKNYINSLAVANFTQDFEKETLELLNRVYRNLWYSKSKLLNRIVRFDSFDVLDTRSITKNEDVHYIYTIEPYIEEESFGKLDLHLVYKSTNRSWRMYLKGKGDDTVNHAPLLYRNKQSGEFYEFFPCEDGNNSKLLIAKMSSEILNDDLPGEDWYLTPFYNNYSYIDTGDVALDDTVLKRFRELQINLVNIEKTEVGFYTDFFVDGEEKIHSARYQVQQITDPDDPDYGVIYVVPMMGETLTTGFVIPSETILGNVDAEDLWKIDLSAFPELNTVTIRLELLGKGRRGAVRLLNTSLKKYEIANWVWVYRMMNVR